MENNQTDPHDALRASILSLRSELEDFSRNHGPDREREYETKILPHLCQLRKLNRLSKESGAYNNKRVEELNNRLVYMSEQCDNITFEGQCLNHEVVSAKHRLSPSKHRPDSQGDIEMRSETNGNDMSFFDFEKVGQLDHQTRLQVLDNEETKRKGLQAKLEEVKSEATEIELVCQASEAQLNRIKPYIKQLLDKVDLGDAIRNDRKE